jgi:hypothetical protein
MITSPGSRSTTAANRSRRNIGRFWNTTASHSMNGMSWAALSGLVLFVRHVSQGVALGWHNPPRWGCSHLYMDENRTVMNSHKNTLVNL